MECRKVRLKAVNLERRITSRLISDTPQAHHMAESQSQARKRAKRQRGPSSESPDLEDLDPAPVRTYASAASQTSPVPVANPAPATAPVKAQAIPPTPQTPEVVAPPTPSGQWERHLTRKEKRQLRRADAASKTPNKGKKTPASRPIGEASGKATRATKKAKMKKPRTEAILIKPLGGRSFAEVLGALKAKAKPEDTCTTVKSIRRTQNGEVLLELGKSDDRAAFAANIREALGDKGVIRELEPRTSVEIRDLDGLSTEAEVKEAIKKTLPEMPEGSLKIWLTKPNRREQRMAIAEMRDPDASKLLAQAHLRVGWVNCRLRRRVVVPRCFRCLGFGHSSRACKGPDRSKNCLRCGSSGHTRKNCTAAERCFLCAEQGLKDTALQHLPGTGRCNAFRVALGQEKGKSRK